MSTKIKFNLFNAFFRLFSFLADKTNGWGVFVKPKLLFGSLIMGIGMSACSNKSQGLNPQITCYDYSEMPDTTMAVSSDSLPQDTIVSDEPIDGSCSFGVPDSIATPKPIVLPEPTCYVPAIMCYDPAYPIEPESIESDSMEVFQLYNVEELPEFPQGGQQAMFEFIEKELRFPPLLQEAGIEGRVICRFIVEKDGAISNVEVVRGIHDLLDKEAVRVIEAMPKWIPGKQNGNTVRVYFNIPIRFKI